jgi:hypothetical protein
MRSRSLIMPLLLVILFWVLQILIFRNFAFFNKAFCYIYIGFILTLPYEIPHMAAMLIGLFFGFTIDVFYDTLGMHMASCVFIAYIRPYVINMLTPRGGYDATMELSIQSLGFQWFASYSAILIFIHHTLLFAIESWGLNVFFLAISKIILSTAFTFGVFILLQFLLFSRKR